MWIASKYGFISIVAHRDNAELYIIRAREKSDLSSLFDANLIQETPEADYAYRVFIPRDQAIAVMIELMNGVDYPNFKSSIGQNPEQKHKMPAYHEVWDIMRQFQF
jgi:hypothetical protein